MDRSAAACDGSCVGIAEAEIHGIRFLARFRSRVPPLQRTMAMESDRRYFHTFRMRYKHGSTLINSGYFVRNKSDDTESPAALFSEGRKDVLLLGVHSRIRCFLRFIVLFTFISSLNNFYITVGKR